MHADIRNWLDMQHVHRQRPWTMMSCGRLLWSQFPGTQAGQAPKHFNRTMFHGSDRHCQADPKAQQDWRCHATNGQDDVHSTYIASLWFIPSRVAEELRQALGVSRNHCLVVFRLVQQQSNTRLIRLCSTFIYCGQADQRQTNPNGLKDGLAGH